MHHRAAGQAADQQAYIWTSESPLGRFPSKFTPVPNQLAENFAIRAIKAQPLDYATAVAKDTLRVFGWKRVVFPNAPTYDEYIFGYRSLPIPKWDQADLGPRDPRHQVRGPGGRDSREGMANWARHRGAYHRRFCDLQPCRRKSAYRK